MLGVSQGPMEEALEALERAVQEIEALEAIFGYDEGGFTVHSESALAAALSVVEAGAGELAKGWAAPQLDIELKLQLDEVEPIDGAEPPTARLRCSLPPGYPALCCATVSVSIEGLSRSAADSVTAALTEKAATLVGEEAVMELVQELQGVAPDALAEAAAEMAATTASAKQHGSVGAVEFGRRWIWAQTVTKPPNRVMAVGWANDLGLGGYLKPGSPGIFVFEGEAAACDTFIKQLKAVPNSCLRALSIRGAVTTPLIQADGSSSDQDVTAVIDGLRRLPPKFVDLDISDMGGFGGKCKDCGVGDEFLEFVMQHRAGGGDEPDPELEPEPEQAAASEGKRKQRLSELAEQAGGTGGGPGGELIFCTFHHLLAGKSHTKVSNNKHSLLSRDCSDRSRFIHRSRRCAPKRSLSGSAGWSCTARLG